MSGLGEVHKDFAGEERLFRIQLGEIRRIQVACGTPERPCSIGDVIRRLAACVYVQDNVKGLQGLIAGLEIFADDVRAPIFEGLSGARVLSPGEVTRLVAAEIDRQGMDGILRHARLALEILTGTQREPAADDGEAGERTGASEEIPASPWTSTTSTPGAPN